MESLCTENMAAIILYHQTYQIMTTCAKVLHQNFKPNTSNAPLTFLNIITMHYCQVAQKKGEINKSMMVECTSATTLMWTPAFMHWKLEFVLILFLPQLWCGLGTLPWQNAPGLWHWENSPWGLSGIDIDILNFDFESDNDHGMALEGDQVGTDDDDPGKKSNHDGDIMNHCWYDTTNTAALLALALGVTRWTCFPT